MDASPFRIEVGALYPKEMTPPHAPCLTPALPNETPPLLTLPPASADGSQTRVQPRYQEHPFDSSEVSVALRETLTALSIRETDAHQLHQH